jgi:hypothetical protein
MNNDNNIRFISNSIGHVGGNLDGEVLLWGGNQEVILFTGQSGPFVMIMQYHILGLVPAECLKCKEPYPELEQAHVMRCKGCGATFFFGGAMHPSPVKDTAREVINVCVSQGFNKALSKKILDSIKDTEYKYLSE